MKKPTTKRRPNRAKKHQLGLTERQTIMQALKEKALEGDTQSILALGLYEVTESLRLLHNSGVRM